MAVTNQQEFKVKLSADAEGYSSSLDEARAVSKGAITDTDALEKQMLLLAQAMVATQGAMQVMVGSYQQTTIATSALTTAMHVNETSATHLSDSYQQIASHSQAINTAMVKTQPAIQGNSTAFHTMGEAIHQTSALVTESVATFNHLVNAISILTNPENLQRAANLTQIFSTMAKIRGHAELATNLHKVSGELHGFSETIQEVETQSNETFPTLTTKLGLVKAGIAALHSGGEDNFQSLADRATVVSRALEVLNISLKSVAIAATVTGIGYLAAQFPQVTAVIGPVIEQMGGLVSTFNIFKAGIEKGQQIQGFTAGLGGMGQALDQVGKKLVDFGTNTTETKNAVTSVSSGINMLSGVVDKVATKVGAVSNGFQILSAKLHDTGPMAEFAVRATRVADGVDFIAESALKTEAKLNFFSQTLRKTGDGLKAIEDNFPMFAKVLQLVGGGMQQFSTVISGLGQDISNMGGILKAVVATVPPLMGRFGQALGIISGLSGAFFGLGTLMLKADSTMAKMAGGSLIALALATGGALVAVKALSAAVGGFVEEAGFKLFDFFDKGIPAAMADETALSNFERTIIRLSGSLESGHKNLDSWQKTLLDVTLTAKLSMSDAQNLAKSVAIMGQEFGITQDKQEQLTRAIVTFSKDGQNALEVSDAIRLAFLGTGKQAEEMGLHVNDLALNSSKYAIQLGKVAGNMSRQELVQARLNVIFDQASVATALMVGHHESLEQIQHKIAVSQQEIDSQFAESSIPIYRMFADIQLKILSAVQSLSPGFKRSVADITAWSGAFLIALGAAMKWSFLVAGTLSALYTLNAFIMKSAAAQALLTTAFNITNGAMGAQAVAVTGLSTVFSNFLNLLKGSMIQALTVFGRAVLATIVNISKLTIALLTNPLFLTAAAIAAGIYLVSQAFTELRAELDFMKSSQDLATNATAGAVAQLSIYERSSKAVQAVAKEVMLVFKDLAKLGVSGLISAFVELGLAYAKVRGYFATSAEDQAKWAKSVRDSKEDLRQLAENMGRTGIEMANVFVGAAVAAGAAADKVKALDTVVANFKRTMSLVKGDAIHDAYLKTAALGDAFQKAKADAEGAQFEFSKSFDKLAKEADQTKEMVDDVKNKREEAIKSYLNMVKLQADTMRSLRKEEAQTNIDSLKDKKMLVEASEAESAQRLVEFDKQARGLKSLSTISKAEIAVIDGARLGLIKRNDDALMKAHDDAQKIFVDDRAAAAKSSGDQLRIIDTSYAQQINQLKEAKGRGSMTGSEFDDAKTEANRQRLDAMSAYAAKLTGDQTEINKAALSKQLEDLDNLRTYQTRNLKSMLDEGVMDWDEYQKRVKIIQDKIAKGEALATDEARHRAIMDKSTEEQRPVDNAIAENSVTVKAPMLAMADKIVGAIQGLIDFLPSFLDKVAGIFQGLRDLPLKLGNAWANINESILSMFSNINTNLKQMIDKIIDSSVRFMDKLPDVIANSIAGASDVINHLMQKLPKFIMSALKAAVVMMPVLAAAMIASIVQGVPSMIHEFMHVLKHELPQAFKEALGSAFNELKQAFYGLFTGAKFHMPDLTQQFARITSQIKGSASQIFNISDFKTAAKNVDIGDKVKDAINSSMLNLAQLMGELWKFLVTNLRAVWQWVYDKIIGPAVDLIRSAWQWAYDKVIQPIASVVMTAFQWVSDKIVTPLTTIGQTAFQWVADHVVTPLMTIGQTAFQWVEDHIVNPIRSAFEKIAGFNFPKWVWPDFPKFSWPEIPRPSWYNLSAGGAVHSAVGEVSAVANHVGSVISGGYHKVLGHQEGGLIKGGVMYAAAGAPVMGTDTVPAMLTPGEFVINRHSASRLGMPMLERLNAGQMPGQGGVTANVTLNVSTTQPIDASFVRQSLVPTLLDAIKSATENGRYVINQKGIRA